MAIIQMNLMSANLRMSTDVSIILPFFSTHDYAAGKIDRMFPRKEEKYQVLWLLNGGAGFEQDYIHRSNIVRYAEEHMLAVVTPTGYNLNYDDFDPGMKMCRFVGEELPDVLRNIFPLSDRREDNFIGGYSMGSNGAQKVAIRYPENYAAVLGMSAGSFNVRQKGEKRVRRDYGLPMPPHKPDEMEENCEILKKAIAEGKKLPDFYLIYGETDIAKEGSLCSAAFLQQQGLYVYLEEVPGVGHEWDLWDPVLKRALQELLPIRHGLV